VVARRSRTAWILVVLCAAVIAWGSLTPGGGGFIQLPDVLIHGGAYLTLAWLLRRAMAQGAPAGSVLLPAALAWGYGFLMEGLQAFLPYRSAEVKDLVVNAVGVVVAMVLPIHRRSRSGKS